MSTLNIGFHGEIIKILSGVFLSRAMIPVKCHLNCVPQVKGGSGRNGGAGGRLAISFIDNFFAGNYYSDGGLGNGGENGAAGTVYTKDNSTTDGQKTLRIYNREGDGVRNLIIVMKCV